MCRFVWLRRRQQRCIADQHDDHACITAKVICRTLATRGSTSAGTSAATIYQAIALRECIAHRSIAAISIWLHVPGLLAELSPASYRRRFVECRNVVIKRRRCERSRDGVIPQVLPRMLWPPAAPPRPPERRPHRVSCLVECMCSGGGLGVCGCRLPRACPAPCVRDERCDATCNRSDASPKSYRIVSLYIEFSF